MEVLQLSYWLSQNKFRYARTFYKVLYWQKKCPSRWGRSLVMHSNIKERFNNLMPRYAILPIIAALLINNCIYIGAAQLRNHLSFYSLAISLDEKIPLLTPFVIFYVLAYVQWALNYILIGRDSKNCAISLYLEIFFPKSSVYSSLYCFQPH